MTKTEATRDPRVCCQQAVEIWISDNGDDALHRLRNGLEILYAAAGGEVSASPGALMGHIDGLQALLDAHMKAMDDAFRIVRSGTGKPATAEKIAAWARSG